MAKSNTKKRNWTFVLYPESAPEAWEDQISLRGLKWAHSPLHDKDLDPSGEPKKPHYHVIIMYPGPTTFNQVKDFVVDELGQPMPLPLDSVMGMYRYFYHLDNPDKYQYDQSDKHWFNGFDVADIRDSLSVSEQRHIARKLLQLVREIPCHEYKHLIDYLDFNNLDDLLDFALGHTVFFKEYIKGQWRIDTGNEDLPH